MKIGLIDVDSHNYPNYALMKISAYHKVKGDSVEWASPLFGEYDRIYKSKIFTFTPDDYTRYDCEVIKGGTGYDIASRLPEEIENFEGLDYSIYPYDFSVVFTSRGCIRKCPFCVVSHKEGYINPVPPSQRFLNPKGKYIEVMDNNFFANPQWKEAVYWLNATKQPIRLMGIDARILTDEQCQALSTMRHKDTIHIAWDNISDKILHKIVMMTKYIKPEKISCYVLVGYNSTIEDDLTRIYSLRAAGIVPFVAPFRDYDNLREPTQYEKDLARWANNRWLFKSFDFENFEPRKGFKCVEYLNK